MTYQKLDGMAIMPGSFLFYAGDVVYDPGSVNALEVDVS